MKNYIQKGEKMQKRRNPNGLRRLVAKKNDTTSPFSPARDIFIIVVSVRRYKAVNIGSADIGETIRILRTARGMTRAELSEAAEISESHLNKIEAGTRQPGIGTYQRIMTLLGADVIIKNENKTLKGKCVEKAQGILLNSTDAQAVYLTRMLESMSENLNLVM